ncbi:MAG: thymidine phosphorylase, partial [Myxococcaceae bacterium]|nr:thymidine phosphorylase [Myxococcaceae bacterium]
RTMIDIGAEMGKRVVALLTDMDQPLGRTVGNALEVREAVEMLRGQAPPDYTELTLALTAEMLVLGRRAQTLDEARTLLGEAVRNGAAERKLRELVAAQGGDPAAVEDLSRLPRARQVVPIISERRGVVTAIDSEAIGLAAMALGAGREKTSDVIDPAVGFVLERKVGDAVAPGEALVTAHVNDDRRLDEVIARVRRAYALGEAAPPPRPLVLERLG